MKIRVALVNETVQDVISDGPIAPEVDGGVLTLFTAGRQWLAAFAPGCWLSAAEIADEGAPIWTGDEDLNSQADQGDDGPF